MVMMDSGAFSAYNSGKPIDLPEFIKWQHELTKECPRVILRAGLDDLKDWELTIKNQTITDEAGLDLFPTFHRFDPISLHEWILERKYPMLAYGGLVQGALTESDDIGAWLDKCYERVCVNGIPTEKIHLFGVSNIELINKYPCYSSDSASALFTGSFGAINIPKIDQYTLKPNWSLPMVRFAISKESPNAGVNGQHYFTLKPAVKEIIRAYVETIPGMSVELLADRHEARKVFCVIMQRMQAEQGFPENPIWQPTPKEDFFA